MLNVEEDLREQLRRAREVNDHAEKVRDENERLRALLRRIINASHDGEDRDLVAAIDEADEVLADAKEQGRARCL